MTFDNFYSHYLTLHQNKWNRMLHALGTTLSLAAAMYAIVTLNWLLLIAAAFVPYPFAWFGHIALEKNRPAAWSNPFYSRVADYKMIYQMMRGDI